jgi:ubiquitin C-terminal hydrolase
MSGEDQYHCEKCQRLTNASRRVLFKKLPQVLPVHLRRFSYNAHRAELEKLDFHLAFPKRLYLSDEAGQKAYQLQAAVIHLGKGMMLGHYICLARRGHRWFELNDEALREASPRDIFRIYGGQQVCAYILMYRQV